MYRVPSRTTPSPSGFTPSPMHYLQPYLCPLHISSHASFHSVEFHILIVTHIHVPYNSDLPPFSRFSPYFLSLPSFHTSRFPFHNICIFRFTCLIFFYSFASNSLVFFFHSISFFPPSFLPSITRPSSQPSLQHSGIIIKE